MKVLWLVNPLHFSETDFEFPIYLQNVSGCSLYCIFLEDIPVHSMPVFTGDPMFPAVDFNVMSSGLIEDQHRDLEPKKESFRNLCRQKKLHADFHDDQGNPVDEVVEESRYADLILVRSSESFSFADEHSPSHFVKKVLSKAECPVLILPDDHQTISEIFFTYNGGYSSVYAIRQFTYVFPFFKNLPVTILCVEDAEKTAPVKHEKELKELLSNHYQSFSFRILTGNAESELLGFLRGRKNMIATFGAFGRNDLSKYFRRSTSDKIIETLDIPLFITHP